MSGEEKPAPEFVIEVTAFERKSYKKDEKDVQFIEILGRDVADDTFRRALAFQRFYGALDNEMSTLWDGSEDLAARGLVLKLRGEIRQPQNDKMKPYISISQFQFVSGPQADLLKLRKSGARALKTAGLALDAGNLKDAYRSLEEYVARLTGLPAPSIDGTFDFDSAAEFGGPEEAAMERLAERDARSGVESAKPAELAPAPAAEAAPDTVVDAADGVPAQEASAEAPVQPASVADAPIARAVPARPGAMPRRPLAPPAAAPIAAPIAAAAETEGEAPEMTPVMTPAPAAPEPTPVRPGPRLPPRPTARPSGPPGMR